MCSKKKHNKYDNNKKNVIKIMIRLKTITDMQTFDALVHVFHIS